METKEELLVTYNTAVEELKEWETVLESFPTEFNKDKVEGFKLVVSGLKYEIDNYGKSKAKKVKKNIPEVTDQMLIDAGLNAFGLKLFVESIANKEDVKSFKPLTFIYKGVMTTIQPVTKDGE